MTIRATRFLALFLFLALMSWAAPARAYVWMIRHGYSGCAVCHEDPSGGGLLNDFGLQEAADSLRSHYGSDPPAVQRFFGLPTPAWLLLGGSFRAMDLETKTDGAPYANSLILMQADLRAGIDVHHWHAAASLGFLANGGSPAAIATSQGGPSLVAREYWAGYGFLDDTLLVRAGRINVPYGLRVIEHTFYVREATRVDINDTQQVGVAVAYRRGAFHGELMGIAGNYQISPDAYRERGYAGYLEWSPASGYAVGVNSLVTYAARDVYLQVANLRQAHGLTGRASPGNRWSCWARSTTSHSLRRGSDAGTVLRGCCRPTSSPGRACTSWARARPIILVSRGRRPRGASGAALTGFSYSHADARFDYRHGEDTFTFGATALTKNDAYMIQLHVFL